MEEIVFAVDLGGTQIRAAAVSSADRILARTALPTPAQEGPQAIIEAVIEAVGKVIDESRVDQPLAIGVGAPGPVDPKTGAIFYPPNLPGWGNRSILPPLQQAYPCPIFVGNDANVAALGELRFGSRGSGATDLIYVTVSTGIGGGIISHGRLLTGKRGFAAEIGHQTLVPDGPLCGCGQHGHLEALASGPAIARMAREAVGQGETSSLSASGIDPDEWTSADVAQAAADGDALALQVFQRAGAYIGLGLTNLIHILEPEVILIGGGVTQAGDLLFDPIRRTVHDHVMSDIYRTIEILPAELGEDVGLYGAAALAQFGIETG
jgi:glucokinase